jgi:three-Cys-motif partner protein
MNAETFFDESREQSIIKTTIVHKYFWAWAKVIIPTAKKTVGKIGYIDLFCGPGRYKDGTKSTPLYILEKAVQDPDMRQMLVTIFNDLDPQNTESLQNAIFGIPGLSTLKYKPQVINSEVGIQIETMFQNMGRVPTLFFVDPWGYKGLSLGLINSVIKNWGCDCIFFFNYNRINMGLNNPYVRDHMDALFGKQRADTLRQKLEQMTPSEREMEIVEQLTQALKSSGSGMRYVLPFCFKNEKGSRTSHHLIFVTKHFRGYEIMKEIMAQRSTSSCQGVPSFEYCQADISQPMLFELSRPLDDLEQMLLIKYAGQKTNMQWIYEEHSVGRPFLEKNYRDALKNLENQGLIITYPPKSQRRPGTFSDRVQIIFPPIMK